MKSPSPADTPAATTPGLPDLPDLASPLCYTNRELSWLEFNARVLEEGLDETVPLLDRLKFLAIVSSNFDEFFQIRVGGLKEQLHAGVEERNADGLSPQEQLKRISMRTHELVDAQYKCFREIVMPGLEQIGIRFRKVRDLGGKQKEFVDNYFTDVVFPVLTPLAVDPAHPFPHVLNKSLNIAVTLRGTGRGRRHETSLAIVQVPGVLDRLVRLPEEASADGGGQIDYVLLGDLIAAKSINLFPGLKVLSTFSFRVSRNADLDVDEDEADDLLKAIEKELRARNRGEAVRLEHHADADPETLDRIRTALGLDAEDCYAVQGPLQLSDFLGLYGVEAGVKYREAPYTPQPSPLLRDTAHIFEAIQKQDILLHHPYESFGAVIDFIRQAANDPNVLAIKQTLYRAGSDSPIMAELQRAAENGKQVTVLVELRARFDEQANIKWARALEKAGVHVVYGLIGLKTHCKVALVVRREGSQIRRYVHLGTGNYNPSTARMYGDVGLFTCKEAFGADATALFNLLTGYGRAPSWHRLCVAPIGLRERVIELIDREAKIAADGGRGRIIAKMNSLVDPLVIQALYRASRAGVEIDLIIRGICCLRAGVPGLSERIRVRSIVDRFLEHSRIFYFEAGGAGEVYCSSADWMPRNFIRRVETMFPIEDPVLRTRMVDEILAGMLADNVKARILQPDGTWKRVERGPDEPEWRSQFRFMERAKSSSSAAAPEHFAVRTIHSEPPEK